MGIPRSEEQAIFHHSNIIIGFTDGEYVPTNPDGTLDEMAVTGALITAGQELAQLVTELAEERQRDPEDDLMTALVNAEIDGDSLTPQEIGSFFILLVVAGNETTRNAIAHGLHVLTEHPDQRQRWMSDFDALAPTAVDEIVRWATPVIHFRRTVAEDGARIGDQTFNEGDKVVLWYNSANRDEAVIDDPYTFDITRSPNEHVGFGGTGIALLPRRPPRPPRDDRHVPRAVPAHPRHPRHGPPGQAAVELHPRHQAPARRVHTGRRRGLTPLGSPYAARREGWRRWRPGIGSPWPNPPTHRQATHESTDGLKACSPRRRRRAPTTHQRRPAPSWPSRMHAPAPRSRE